MVAVDAHAECGSVIVNVTVKSRTVKSKELSAFRKNSKDMMRQRVSGKSSPNSQLHSVIASHGGDKTVNFSHLEGAGLVCVNSHPRRDMGSDFNTQVSGHLLTLVEG